MINKAILSDLRSRTPDLLDELEAPTTWLTGVVNAYNARVRAVADDQPVECNPLLTRLLFDRLNLRPITVPAILRLVRYFKGLPEYSDRAWRGRRAAILGEDFGAFHSALTELSLHEALARVPGLGVRFIDTEPGGRKRADYEINFRRSRLEGELKSILSERVRAPAGAHFIGSLDAATARAVWRKFTQPYREGQLDPTQPSVVFIDISLCDELYLFFALLGAPPRLGVATPRGRPPQAAFRGAPFSASAQHATHCLRLRSLFVWPALPCPLCRSSRARAGASTR